MSGGPPFIDRSVFGEIMAATPRVDGTSYEDVNTIYGDLSRLVVALMAKTPPEEIIKIYNDLGWGGNANGRAIHETAKAWMAKYRNSRS